VRERKKGTSVRGTMHNVEVGSCKREPTGRGRALNSEAGHDIGDAAP
jgi:hypothetical protein